MFLKHLMDDSHLVSLVCMPEEVVREIGVSRNSRPAVSRARLPATAQERPVRGDDLTCFSFRITGFAHVTDKAAARVVAQEVVHPKNRFRAACLSKEGADREKTQRVKRVLVRFLSEEDSSTDWADRRVLTQDPQFVELASQRRLQPPDTQGEAGLEACRPAMF